jgi:hypothetical protein
VGGCGGGGGGVEVQVKSQLTPGFADQRVANRTPRAKQDSQYIGIL